MHVRRNRAAAVALARRPMHDHSCAVRLAALLAFAAPAAAQGPALTIYNQNFAVVRERVPLDLQAGTNTVRFKGVTTQLEADSVVLRDPTGALKFTIVEQDYRADTVSQGLLLAHFEGREIDFVVADRDGGRRTVRGKIVRSGYAPAGSGAPGGVDQAGPIVEVDGTLRFGLPGQPLFPSLGDDSILQPTLTWRLHGEQAGKGTGELGYITGGLQWQAAYNVIAPERGDTLDLVGWITIDNRSGKEFRDATIKLMAGNVHKLQPPTMQPLGTDAFFLGAERAAAPQVTEKAFDEFHLYTLPLATTLRDRQQKQVEFVRALAVAAKTLYVYEGAALAQYRGWDPEAIRSQPDYGTQSNAKVWVMREFENTAANGLGLPLPKGRLRFYRRDDSDGRLEFTGENVIDHTPKDERVRVYTGDAFDVVGERKRIDFLSQRDGRQIEEEFEVRVRNRKDTAVEVRIVERLYRWSNWRVIRKSHDFVPQDAQAIEFRVPVPPGGEQVVTYRVRYDW
jgi:hypothetical protein